MDRNFQRVMKKAERIFAALDKGDKSPRRYAQLAELQKELDALIPGVVPEFLKTKRKTKAE